MWLVLVVATGVSGRMIHLAMIDAVERDIPPSERPSFHFKLQRANVVALHAQMYPQSRLRLLYRICFGVVVALFFGPFLFALLRSCDRRI